LLHIWEQNGLIQTKYGRISIKQPDALRKLAYPDCHERSVRKPALHARSSAPQNKELT
jgi:CRP/FNR family transcriptional regulator, cyclic AMP receptor protein